MIQFEEQGQAQHATVGGDLAEVVVPDLGQHRVHHQQQTDGDRQRDRVDLDPVECLVEAGEQLAERDAQHHGGADPQRQEPVERGELVEDRCLGVLWFGDDGHASARWFSPGAGQHDVIDAS
ncbi:MAG: hypothetical protein U5K30_11525 [Acidimicrobiales bacterium]|nr:hypothetical protein [Acidimicrobiales bacterium]